MERTAAVRRLCLAARAGRAAGATPIHTTIARSQYCSTSPPQARATASCSASSTPGIRQIHTSRCRESATLNYDTPTTLPRIRSASELYDVSGKKGKRLIVKNEELAERIAAIVTKDAKNMTVLDLYPGNGILSRALLKLPDVESVVAAEQADQYYPELDKLLEENAGRFQYVTLDPFWWDAYSMMKEKEYLSQVAKIPWEQPHTGLSLFAFVPNSINGERLVVQHLTCIPEGMWLYDYGRFSSYYLINGAFAKRLLAKPGEADRHKVAVMFEALVDVEAVISTEELKPANTFFARHAGRSAIPAVSNYALIKFTPKKDLLVQSQQELEVLEFLARNLFIHGSRKWTKTLKYLGPGAEILIDLVKQAGGRIDPAKTARQLTIAEWAMLVKAFLAWPFRPMDLEQSDLRDAAEFADD